MNQPLLKQYPCSHHQSLTMVMDILKGKMGCTPILSVKVSVKKDETKTVKLTVRVKRLIAQSTLIVFSHSLILQCALFFKTFHANSILFRG